MVLPFIGFWASNQIVFWAGWDVNWKLFAAVGLGLVLFAVQELSGKGPSMPLDLKAGWWVLPWFGLLALVSYLGTFSSDGKPHGQANVIPFGWDFLAIFALSAAVFAVAIRSRLDTEAVTEMFEGSRA
jgi:CDP-diglyceride synthetase